MTGWQTALVVVGVVGLGIALVVVALMSLASRNRPLQRAVRRLSFRAEEAQRLQVKLDAMQQRVAALQELVPDRPEPSP